MDQKPWDGISLAYSLCKLRIQIIMIAGYTRSKLI